MNARARWGLLLVSAAMAATGYWLGSRGTSPIRLPKVSLRHAQATSEVASTARKADAETWIANVSSTEDPRSRYIGLTRRAQAGDRDAASELAQWLQRCAEISSEKESKVMTRILLDRDSNQRASSDASLDARLNSNLGEIDRRIENARVRCRGILPEQLATRGHWFYQAAQLGDTKSALAFGTGWFLHSDLLNELDQIPFWRDHAEQALQQALEGGESEAVRYLAFAYDPSPSIDFSGPHLSSDPERAYAYYSVLSMLKGSSMVGDALERLGAGLDPDQIASATRLAADICAEDIPGACEPAQTK